MSGYPPISGVYAPAVNVWTVIRENERVAPLDVPGKITGFPLKCDDIVEIRSVGSGGTEKKNGDDGRKFDRLKQILKGGQVYVLPINR